MLSSLKLLSVFERRKYPYNMKDLILQWNWELTLFEDYLDSIPSDNSDQSVLRANFWFKSRDLLHDTMKERDKSYEKAHFNTVVSRKG